MSVASSPAHAARLFDVDGRGYAVTGAASALAGAVLRVLASFAGSCLTGSISPVDDGALAGARGGTRTPLGASQ